MSSFFRTAKSLSLTLIAGLLLLFAAGCGESADATVDKIRVVDGAEQCTLPGTTLRETGQARTPRPAETGHARRSGESSPPPPERWCSSSTADGIRPQSRTRHRHDRRGRRRNDQRHRRKKPPATSICASFRKIIPGKSITLRFITGMRIDGVERQYRTGSVTVEPLSVNS